MLRPFAVTLALLVLATALMAKPPAAIAGTKCLPTYSFLVDGGWAVCAGQEASVGAQLGSRSSVLSARPEDTTTGGPAEAAGGGTAPDFCTYSATDTVDGTPAPAPPAAPGQWVFVYCGDSGQPGGWTWVPAGGGAMRVPSPAELARQAYAQLRPVIPAPDFNPRRQTAAGDGTVVGLDTWLWLNGGLEARSVSASAGPNRATVTARPVSVSFDPGDGSGVVVCPGGGTAYDVEHPNRVSDCTHRYTVPSAGAPGGVFVLTARVEWAATWTGSGGTGGTLPALTIASQTPIRVFELQALNE